MSIDPNLEISTPADAIEPLSFDLQKFFPYLVRVFYSDVTSAISSVYQSEYDMTPAEWRSMVIIGPDNKLTANDIVVRSSMDKVAVSRALARMQRNGWVATHANPSDRRSKLLSLSATGKAIYHELIPQVLGVEKQLLAGISAQQQQQFIDTMARIRANKKLLDNNYINQ